MARACDWRYVPKKVFTRDYGMQPVARIIAHPPGGHPSNSPIVKSMIALEIIPVRGRSSFVGVEKAKINAELKMVACGGFINPRNELAKSWKPCRKACDGAGFAGARKRR